MLFVETLKCFGSAIVLIWAESSILLTELFQCFWQQHFLRFAFSYPGLSLVNQMTVVLVT